jgi:hypothetical protein
MAGASVDDRAVDRDTGAGARSHNNLVHVRITIYSAVMAKGRIGTFVAAVMSTSLVVAPPAQADNSSDFLTRVSAEGLNVGDTPPDVELTLSTAVQVCRVMFFGLTPQDAGRMVPYRFPEATPQQIAGFVDAAQATMCAQIFTPLQQGPSY